MPIENLIRRQNRDGGWPYVRGVSWTEPTVYAVLALQCAGENEPAQRGMRWILGMQRPDGGWPPQAGIDQSTWVTALAALLPKEQLGSSPHARAIEWLLGTAGKESSSVYRLREWLLGNGRPADQEFAGWPWIPGTAAWVGPTSLAILALEREGRQNPSPRITKRVSDGRRFLLSRMCQEGGWNHGSVHALGYESQPYPETTGMALAALRGVNSPQVARSLNAAKNFLAGCQSGDAMNWLRLGLLAHGALPADYCPPAEITYRTLQDTSLEVLASETQKGRSLFWS
jgi:hypothetical protein